MRVGSWNQLQRIRTSYERKIRWFLIKSEEGLEEQLTKLYRNIVKYNSSIDELIVLGELRTRERFQHINLEREKLHLDMEKILESLSSLRYRFL